jgi:LmbE family N-acetylglucosaminyl deacetylase
MKPLSRRDLLGATSRLTGSIALGLPFAGASAASPETAAPSGVHKAKIVVAGGHPDDPESGCGGTIARYTDLGHEVAIIYLTRGEAGIDGKSHAEAAAIRTAEALKACEILKARPIFAGQIDGSTEITPASYEAFGKILDAEAPDVVYTHWPVDSHRDHRATSLLVYDAWIRGGKRFALYYFEVMTGRQTSHFWPTHYVDITATEARKRASYFAHSSQQPDKYYPYHDEMNRYRGMESGRKYAEAYMRHLQSPDDSLPGAL